ncbi:hypothetical protein V6N13_129829 [Hibiscus sabdariffa]|uniref:Uncharacterized protein n=1 Tax=Hibiscus sabdariffa TaxID=183260 RepID=A0ABR2SN83_9ROSI
MVVIQVPFEDVTEEVRGNDWVVMEVESEETIVKHGISDTLCSDETNNAENVSSHENLSPQLMSSFDHENNEKENINPQAHEYVDLSPTISGDHVKAFVDEEGEEEDGSDHDIILF